MPGVLERLRDKRVMVADGAMGTMLFERGLKPGECPERINLEHPEILEEIANLYIEAGAEIIQTNTFGGSPMKLAPYRLDDRTEEINAGAVQAARKAAAGRVFVAGSCGPTGRILKPYGDTEPGEIQDTFVRQMRSLIDAGVDMISIETMTDVTEARLAVLAARSISSSIPVCASMTFDATPRGFFTIMGVTIKQAAEGLIDAGADIIGSNCGNGIENMVGIAAEFRKYSDYPISIRSNAGIPRLVDGHLAYPETPDYMACRCRELVEWGANIIGGCCGTTPEHIAAIRIKVGDLTIS